MYLLYEKEQGKNSELTFLLAHEDKNALKKVSYRYRRVVEWVDYPEIDKSIGKLSHTDKFYWVIIKLNVSTSTIEELDIRAKRLEEKYPQSEIGRV